MAAGARTAVVQRGSNITVDICPIGDGGEGTMDALVGAMGGEIHEAQVVGPTGSHLRARYATCQRIGIVEMAEASGLAKVPESQRDPTMTTSFGAGELVRAAIDRGSAEVIVCIGGSATVDGGAGMCQALGARFFDSDDRLMNEPMTGAMLKRIARAERPRELPIIRVACDVTNPLCGPSGAAVVYGPQKGATPVQVKQLDEALAHYAAIIGGDVNMPGAGAAGGAGFGLAVMCNAKLMRGIPLVLDVVQFKRRCAGATIVLTGEGRLDEQSLHGKACMGVAQAALQLGVPTLAIVGSTGRGAERCRSSHGGFLQDYVSLSDRFGMARSLSQPSQCIEETAHELIRHWPKFPFASQAGYT